MRRRKRNRKLNEASTDREAWYLKVFDALEAIQSPPEFAACSQREGAPDWVKKVEFELLTQTWPAVPLRDSGIVTPKKLGLLLGQYCANLYAVNSMLAIPADQSVAGKIALGRMKSDRSLPRVEKPTLLLLNYLAQLLRCVKTWSASFRTVLHDAFHAALYQPSHAEALAFFQGFARGMARQGFGREGVVQSTPATPIYLVLYTRWQAVCQLKSVTELRDFLGQNGLSEVALGDRKRLEKICERIGLSLRGRGCPRKQEKSDARRS